MGKKKKVNKKKLISRILMLIIILLIVIFLVKLIFKPKQEEIVKLTLFVDNQDITEKLVDNIYIDTAQKLYMSLEDIKNIFDPNLYFEEETGKVITISGTKVGAIDVNKNVFELNSATLLLSSEVLKYDEKYYIPVSDITNIYNIEIFASNDTAIVLSLYKELITVKTTKKVSLKQETGLFAKTIKKVEEGQELIYLGEADKEGWIKVLTYDGKQGYIKQNKLSDKEYKRMNMNEDYFAPNVADPNNAIKITKKTIKSESISNFSNRKNTISKMLEDCVSKGKYTINLDLKDIGVQTDKLERLILELIPRLKELGGAVMITNNNGILSDSFLSQNNL